MGLPVEINPLLISSSGYVVGRSLRFRSSASAYLNRTPSSAGNSQKFTFSAWVKRGILSSSSNYRVFQATDSVSGAYEGFEFASDTWAVRYHNGSFVTVSTAAVLRDPSAWYHLVGAIDTTDATASNRIKLYINGVQQTTSGTMPAQNYSFPINAAVAHAIASYPTGGEYFDGYLAEVNFIDGQALTPTSFGAYDTNGVWQPLKYGGTYGTNGFYLPFSDTTSTTTLVQDSSGNGNNWTPNNISLTAGTTYDSMIDSPTVSASSSNYCVLNPLAGSINTIQNGNLQLTGTNATESSRVGSLAVSSGKWYFETTITTLPASADPLVGVSNVNSTDLVTKYPGQTSTSYAVYLYTANTYIQKVNAGGFTNTTTTMVTQGDIIGVALDLDNGKIWFSKNNTWIDSGSPTAGTNAQFTGLSGIFVPSFRGTGLTTTTTLDANFGQRPFSYTPPTGYSALNTYNLPTPTIANGAQYMAATLYTGNGTSQSINNSVNGVSFQPDFVWYKDRSVARDHALFNVTSGATYLMSSNNTSAESAVAGTLTSFNSNGYSIGSAANANANGETYVGWQWKAGGTGVTNTSGSITSTVSANTTAGFSIVTYTGTGANATVGHGLGVAPSFIIVRSRNNGGATNWAVWHTSFSSTEYIFLNSTAAKSSSGGAALWNSTLPSSTVFSIGTDTNTNYNTTNMLAYCFAAVSGYSAFGSYTGNGSSDGPFVYTGFRPRFVMVKRTDTVESWSIVDTSRSAYNQMDASLFPNLSNAEGSGNNVCDFLSNGFKLRNAWAGSNASGGTYIYAAFAENPFNYSRAR